MFASLCFLRFQTARVAAPPLRAETPPPQAEKQGFFGRIFGGGGKEEEAERVEDLDGYLHALVARV